MKLQDFKSIHASGKDLSKVVTQDKEIWSGIDDVWGTPGPKKLIGGNMEAGFFGEVPSSELISGENIFKMADLNYMGRYGGTEYRSNSGDIWLKFIYNGAILFVYKKPIAHTLSWKELNSKGYILGQKTINIKDKTYKFRVLRGKNDAYKNNPRVNDGVALHGSEYNRLMLPLHEMATTRKWEKPNNVENDLPSFGTDYERRDLSYTMDICQEYYPDYPESGVTSFVTRGVNGNVYGIEHSFLDSTKYDSNYYNCWRPVLELVQE